MGLPDHLTCLLRNLYAGQEAAVESDMEEMTGSKLGKEYSKAVYCHLAYLTSMQCTPCKMSSWMEHKLETRLLETSKNFLNCRVSLGELSSAKSWMLIGERAISNICSSPWLLPTSRMAPLGWQLTNEGRSSA